MLSFPASNWDQQFLISRQAYTAKTFPRTASRITPRLYLSDCWTARDVEKLTKLGITHVVSIMEQDPKTPDMIPERNRLALTLADHPTADILPILDLTTSFIGAALEENTTNKVLVCRYALFLYTVHRRSGALRARHQPKCDCSVRIPNSNHKSRRTRRHRPSPNTTRHRLSKQRLPYTTRRVRSERRQTKAQAQLQDSPHPRSTKVLPHRHARPRIQRKGYA